MKPKPVDNLGRKMSISKKVTVVTGASSGLGRSIALLFAQNGAKVVLASRDETKLKEVAEEICQKGGEAASVVTNVRNEQQCARLIEEAVKNYGRIDVLVNSAGIGIYGPVDEFSTRDIDALLETNLKGLAYCSRAAYKEMKKQGSGHIINVASIAGKFGLPGESMYVASKFAAVGFSQSLRKEAIRFGVRVHTICPGGMNTPFWERVPRKPDVSKFLKPEHVAQLVLYLASTPDDMVFEDIVVQPKDEYVRRFA